MRQAIRLLIAAAVVSIGARPAAAQQSLGRTIADVRVEVSGVPVGDAAVLELIETRVGEPLSMRDVRSTIAHLVGLGRFEDVRVQSSATPQGVTLQWQLVPVQRVR